MYLQEIVWSLLLDYLGIKQAALLSDHCEYPVEPVKIFCEFQKNICDVFKNGFNLFIIGIILQNEQYSRNNSQLKSLIIGNL